MDLDLADKEGALFRAKTTIDYHASPGGAALKAGQNCVPAGVVLIAKHETKSGWVQTYENKWVAIKDDAGEPQLEAISPEAANKHFKGEPVCVD